MRSMVVGILLVIVGSAAAGCSSRSNPTLTPPSAPPATPAAASSTLRPTSSATPTATATARSAAWLSAGALGAARSRTHAVMLGSGDVLVVGADNICAPATNGSDSVELGDPLAGRWDYSDDLPKPHDRPSLVALRDGSALLTGGLTGEDDGPVAFSSTYLFDPTSGAWSRTGLLHTARYDPAIAVLADGRVLVAGGSYIDRRQRPRVLDSTEIWDPATGRWTRSSPLRRARTGAQAVTLSDGRVLVVGGLATSDAFGPRVSAEIFDPATGRWQQAGRIRTPRVTFALAPLPDGGALVAGGVEHTDVPDSFPIIGQVASAERFDPVRYAWSTTGEMRVAASGRTTVSLADGRVLAAGGDTSEFVVDLVPPEGEPPPTMTADAEIYDPASGAWAATVPLPRPRVGGAGVLLRDGSVVVVGGDQAFGSAEDTPSCPVPDAEVWRYVPGP